MKEFDAQLFKLNDAWAFERCILVSIRSQWSTSVLSFAISHRARAFRLVCEYLSVPPRGNIKEETAKAATLPPSFWVEFIRTSADFLMGPALALRFEELGLSGIVPTLVERHCHAVLRLNRSRNARLRAEAVELALELNRIDVVPLFLKGGAGLLSGLYDDPGARIMGDLDVLVPNDRARDCERLLSELGYSLAPIMRHPRDKTIGIFVRERSIAPIDLHHEVLAYPNQGLLSARETIENSLVYDLDGVTVAVPSTTHQAVLNIGHAHLNDHGYRYGHLPLRSLWDFALLLRESSEIDWQQIDDRFSAIGEQGAADYHCLAVGETMNVKARPDYAPSRNARFLMKRARFLTNHPGLQRIWFRCVRVAMLLCRELSDEELRVRLLRNMRDPAWWRRHLEIFWQGRA